MKNIGRIVMVILSLSIGAYAFTFLDFKIKSILQTKGELAQVLLYQVGFYSHVIGGGIALMTGAFQFFPKFRIKRITWHRFLGRIYVIACAWGGISGLGIALYATGGALAKVGFTSLALFWLYTTSMAYRTIKKGDVQAHREWMLRSFALTFAAVTLRLQLPFYMSVLTMDFYTAYRMVSWSCWVPNLLLIEWFIQRQPEVFTQWIPSIQNSKS